MAATVPMGTDAMDVVVPVESATLLEGTMQNDLEKLVDQVMSEKVEGDECCKCGCPLDLENMSASKGQRHKATCKSCVSIQAMLRRHMGSLPEDWDALSEDSQRSFFQKCSSLRPSKNSPLSYKAVKALFMETMSQVSTTTDETKVEGGFFPLSYYAAKGIDTSLVEATAECETNPVLGQTYFVPFKSKSHSEKHEQIHQKILQPERAIRKRKDPALALPRAKAKAKAGAVPLKLPEEKENLREALKDVVNLETDSEDEDFKARGG